MFLTSPYLFMMTENTGTINGKSHFLIITIKFFTLDNLQKPRSQKLPFTVDQNKSTFSGKEEEGGRIK